MPDNTLLRTATAMALLHISEAIGDGIVTPTEGKKMIDWHARGLPIETIEDRHQARWALVLAERVIEECDEVWASALWTAFSLMRREHFESPELIAFAKVRYAGR